MRNRIANKMSEVNASYYFTENPVNRDGDYDNKYFICINGTHAVIKATKTIREMEEWLDEELQKKEDEKCIYNSEQKKREELLKSYEAEQKEKNIKLAEKEKEWEEEDKIKTEEMARAWEEEWKAEQARMEELLKSEKAI